MKGPTIAENGWQDLELGRHDLVSRDYGFAVREGNGELLSLFSEGLAIYRGEREVQRHIREVARHPRSAIDEVSRATAEFPARPWAVVTGAPCRVFLEPFPSHTGATPYKGVTRKRTEVSPSLGEPFRNRNERLLAGADTEADRSAICTISDVSDQRLRQLPGRSAHL